MIQIDITLYLLIIASLFPLLSIYYSMFFLQAWQHAILAVKVSKIK